jgi:anti-anti-sigma regulatory factor
VWRAHPCGVPSPTVVGDGDKHVCCVFDSDDAFTEAAVDFLRSGLHKERLLYIADRPSKADLFDDLIELGDAELLADEGDLVVGTAREMYLRDNAIDPAGQVESYRALVDAALADGFAGLRVAADATSLVERDDHRRAFMSYELAVDRFVRTAPMSAMCAYDARVLDTKALDLACVHRRVRTGSARYEPGFWLSSAESATLSVAGEVDASNASRFAAALDATVDALDLLPAVSEDQVVLDARGLDFIDAEGATALLSFIERIAPEKTVVVNEAPRSLCAVVDSMGWGDRIHYRQRETAS